MDLQERDWVNIVDILQNYGYTYSVKVIRWIRPESGWVKGNIDGTSKGNPSLSFTAFYIKNNIGDLIVAKGCRIKDTYSFMAEALAIQDFLQNCRGHNIR